MWVTAVVLICFLTTNLSTSCFTSTRPIYDERSRCYTRQYNQDCKHDAIETHQLCNNGRGEIIHIGLVSSRGSILNPLIKLCFDKRSHRTFWTKHELVSTKRKFFSGDVYFGNFNKTVENTFTVKGLSRIRRVWLKKFFEGVDVDSLYRIDSVATDRGHLSPVADFVSDIDKEMTFYYINAAPQLSSFNRGEWRILEDYLRDRTYRHSRSFATVITGSGGVFLTLDRGLNYTYPEYFFKVFIPSPGARAEVYIGVNMDINDNYFYMKNLCNVNMSCDWYNSFKTSRNNRKVYCCDLDRNLKERLGLEEKDMKFGLA